MISNQTVINTAIATNIAATAIRKTKASRISYRKTNNFHYKSIIENKKTTLRHTVIFKNIKDKENNIKLSSEKRQPPT